MAAGNANRGAKPVKKASAAEKTPGEAQMAEFGSFFSTSLTHRIRQHSLSLIDQFFSLSAGLWNFKTFNINSFT